MCHICSYKIIILHSAVLMLNTMRKTGRDQHWPVSRVPCMPGCLMTHCSTPWSRHRGPLVPGTRYIVTDHINDLKQAPAQAPEIYVLCGDSALHLSKQRSFTSCLFSPRAPHSSPISRSPHCLEIGVKIPRLSPLDQQHNYLRCRHQRMSQQSANQRPALADLTNQRLCMAAC